MLQALLLLVGLGLLAFGGEGLYYAYSNPQQVTMRCAEYAQSRPSALWLRLTDCEADYLGAGYRESGGQIAELFFPVRPTGRPRTEPAALVAATSDPQVLAIAQATVGEGRQPNQEQFIVMMLKIITALGASREIEGWGRAGIVKAFDTRRSLASLSSPIEPDAIVLDLHARPDPTVPAIQAGAGAVALAGALLLHLRSKRAGVLERTAAAAEPVAPAVDQGRSAPAPEGVELGTSGTDPGAVEPAHVADQPAVQASVEPAADMLAFPAEDKAPVAPPGIPPAPPGIPPAPPGPAAAAPRLRGLLLLRLPPSANASDIENAPPLGARDAVERRIAELVPGIRFDESGQGSVSGPDHLLVVDLGPDPLVPTAVARAEGTEGIELLKTLLTSAGWRAYSPRTASFVDPDRLHAAAVPGEGDGSQENGRKGEP
jgi:hypothetical protein